jgi:quercetin dioxygenase-like cupin family protein
MITAGRGAVRSGGGDWETVNAGQAVVWRAGEEHTTKATDDLTAVAIEMVAIPLELG